MSRIQVLIRLKTLRKRLNQNRDLKTELKEAFYDWSIFTTAHGIPSLSRTESKKIRFLWIAFLLATTAYCCYSMISIIVSYFSYNVLINMQIVVKSNVDFPAVTVCNLNPFDRRYSQNYIDKVLAKYNLSSSFNYYNKIGEKELTPNEVLYLFKSNIASDYNLTMEQKRKFGYEIDYMLLTCYYNDKKCNSSDFIWRYDLNYGNCFTFNSGYDQNGSKVPILKMNEPGSDRSFKLELFLGDEFSQGIYMDQSGARVVVHNQSITPLIEQEGKDLSTNYQTDIGIYRYFLSKLESPYSNCVKDVTSPNGFDSNFYKAMFNKLNMTAYRQKNCLKLSLQEYIKNLCGCIDGSLPNIYGQFPVCTSLDEINCLGKSGQFIETNSFVDCPIECDSVDYRLSITKSRYPTLYYTQYLRHQTSITKKANVPNDNYIQKNIVLLNVFYEDLATVFINEKPEVTSDVLFGNIGGNLGLFLGMSLVSFVEIIELAIKIIVILIKRRKKKITPYKIKSISGNKNNKNILSKLQNYDGKDSKEF